MGSLPLDSVDIEFRSAEDPFILLQRVTGGTLDLGETSSHLRWVGAIFIAISLLLGIPCCVTMCQSIRKAHSMVGPDDENYEGLFGDDDDDGL